MEGLTRMTEITPTRAFAGKVHPMLFNGPMVRALLREISEPGTGKTVTRRVLDDPPVAHPTLGPPWMATRGITFRDEAEARRLLPEIARFRPGDLIYVRETWAPGYYHDPDAIDGIPKVSVIYDADKSEIEVPSPNYSLAEEWYDRFSDDGPDDPILRPSIHMPRWASRITMRVTEVTVERLQDITEEDAIREGLKVFNEDGNLYYSGTSCDWFSESDQWHCDPTEAFARLWDSTKPKPGFRWEDNPWVSVIRFRPELANVDHLGAEVEG